MKQTLLTFSMREFNFAYDNLKKESYTVTEVDIFDANDFEVEAQQAEKKGEKKKSRVGQLKPGFIAIFGDFFEAKTKRELRKYLEAGGHKDVTIVRGKIMPTARVTRLSF